MNFVDLSGNKFGKLTVLERCENTSKSKTHPAGVVSFLCICDCGNKKIVRGCHLKQGNVKSCGCLFEFSGKKFGRLFVINKTGKRDRFGSVLWNCICDCGKKVIIPTQRLNNGNTKSCGCLNREIVTNRVGLLSPTWKCSITNEERIRGRFYKEYSDWIKFIYARDDYKCRICGIAGNGKNLNAHHLNSYSHFPELRTKLSNGITLCLNCHSEFHSLYGKIGNTAEQFYEWISS